MTVTTPPARAAAIARNGLADGLGGPARPRALREAISAACQPSPSGTLVATSSRRRCARTREFRFAHRLTGEQHEHDQRAISTMGIADASTP